ncbi:unnamed protein product [Rotaria sp. Silwood1]|nr:unnamed protein product [Rotaria sp. Silwood1]
MPPQLRDKSPAKMPNLPLDFNLTTSDTTTINTRSNVPNVNGQQLKQKYNQSERRTTTTTITASYRRRQQQTDISIDIESNYDDEINDVLSIAAYDIADHNEKEQMKQNKMNRINDKNNNTKLKRRIYLESNRIIRYMQDNSSVIAGGHGNQAYILATAPIYDEWIRNNYELQLLHAQEKRDDITNSRFIKKKINRLTSNIAQASATITNLQVQLSTYWTQTTAGAINPSTATTSSSAANTGRIHNAVDRLKTTILKYIQRCTQHKAATPNQWNIHLMLKLKVKQWSTKYKNYHTATKRVEYDLPPKFISNVNLTFKIDELIIRFDIESDAGYIAFKHYNELCEKRFNFEAEQSIYFLEEQRVEGAVNEQEEIVALTVTRSLTEEEHQLLKLGPRFIYNDPKAASRRRTTEWTMLKRKIEARLFEKKR